jgi:hypothetical protein
MVKLKKYWFSKILILENQKAALMHKRQYFQNEVRKKRSMQLSKKDKLILKWRGSMNKLRRTLRKTDMEPKMSRE